MSRVEPPRPPLPTLPERAAPRPQDGDFWARLQAAPAGSAPDASALAAPAGDTDGPVRERGREGREEVFAWSALAGHRLSYLDPELASPPVAAPAPRFTAADAPVSALVSAAAPSPAGAGARMDAPVAGMPLTLAAGAPLPASAGSEVEPLSVSAPRVQVSAELLRRLHLLPVTGGVELVLRDYDQSLGPDPVPRLLDHCRDRGLDPLRIVLNGHIVWSRQPSGKE